MKWITVSTKVRRELLEKAREHGINVSKVLRRALEEEVKRKEEEEARRAANKVAESIHLSPEEVARIIREARDSR
ncbi:VapB-type antitoxin [Candidatus Marsarchaeota G2 archaeon BE_D]|jgi:antitoxin CcdA|uniref:VapB-type antitoxin n=1 Tax=Candidatus Marsarchaeota G2 archaeon BE_D TaxID=1978158 RepID=A0A2R6C6T2_9ARCH|nr:MAG: VapB-type antitoxin [Candidatus Marsarchaeota G2 archaeon BE_D]